MTRSKTRPDTVSLNPAPLAAPQPKKGLYTPAMSYEEATRRLTCRDAVGEMVREMQDKSAKLEVAFQQMKADASHLSLSQMVGLRERLTIIIKRARKQLTSKDEVGEMVYGLLAQSSTQTMEFERLLVDINYLTLNQVAELLRLLNDLLGQAGY